MPTHFLTTTNSPPFGGRPPNRPVLESQGARNIQPPSSAVLIPVHQHLPVQPALRPPTPPSPPPQYTQATQPTMAIESFTPARFTIAPTRLCVDVPAPAPERLPRRPQPPPAEPAPPPAPARQMAPPPDPPLWPSSTQSRVPLAAEPTTHHYHVPDQTSAPLPEITTPPLTTLNILRPGHAPWREGWQAASPYRKQEAVPCVTVDEVMQKLGADWVVETWDVGEGRWRCGPTYHRGEETARTTTLAEAGWNARRGKQSPPVWLAWS